jgi:BirA family biotin operon repressor/biotin-[acetyl-CoA-carboxylase] ligase
MMEVFECGLVDSTQEEAKRLIKKGVTKGVVSAEGQKSGKGRGIKTWESPKGNLYLTFILQIPQDKIKESSTLSLVLAAVTANKFNLQLKWPNDLLHFRAKVGGILGEGLFEKNYFLLLGLGLNVGSHPTLDRPTTSIDQILDQAVDLKFLRELVITSFDTAFSLWLDKGFLPFFPLWNSLLIHQPGDQLTLQGKTYTYLGSDSSGGLQVEYEGVSTLLSSGEIV